jgi:hypothetical protein
MICFVYLQSSLDALYKAEENRETKDCNSDPEGVPLRPVSSIVPELREGGWFRLIESFLQAHQLIAPVLEVYSTAISRHHHVSIQQRNVRSQGVIVSRLLRFQPSLGNCVLSWEQ